MKASYPTVDVTIGTTKYHVHLRVQPSRDAPHVSADSPSYLKPGTPRRVSIIRILKNGEGCPDLFWATWKAIEREVTRLAARGLLSPGAVGFSPPSTGGPSFADAERFR